MKTRRLARYLWTGANPQFRALLVLILCADLHAYAQKITGTIAGTVKDPQGAVVMSATVKATNVDTGLSRSTTTADGAYLIQYLPIGTYSVEVDAAGFKRFVQQDIVLTVDQTQALNVVLAVGIESQTVTVTGAPPLVDTNSAELGRTVEPSEIIGLPLVNRNAYAELSLAPGVQANTPAPADMVSMIKGKHSLNFGSELSLEKDMIVGNLDNFGIFNFASSAPTSTGNALADFVTGQVSTMQQDTPYHGLLSAWYFADFLEDNYRLFPRLTLNLGLRYDVQLSPVE
jgi:hypothetical protein